MIGPVDVLAVMDVLIAKADANQWGFAAGREVAALNQADEARATVAELIADLRRIEARAKAHPDDTDDDRKRNLYHVESIARMALTRCNGGAA